MLTTTTRYVIRRRVAPRLYYAAPHLWVSACEAAQLFEFLTIAECYAMITLGLTDLDYTVEALAVMATA